MKETTSSSMPPCFDRWCQKFDHLLRTKAQKREFRNYLGGLLGESERKNISQMADNNLDITYHKLHHFLTESTWKYEKINEQRLQIINSYRQGWLGLSEYQVRNKRSLMRHFILVFCAYTFIQWHRLTGGLRRQWGNKPLNTFGEACLGVSYSNVFSIFSMVER